jgi:hypothetical protein
VIASVCLVVLLSVGEPARVIEIENSTEGFQGAIGGGYIEVII